MTHKPVGIVWSFAHVCGDWLCGAMSTSAPPPFLGALPANSAAAATAARYAARRGKDVHDAIVFLVDLSLPMLTTNAVAGEAKRSDPSLPSPGGSGGQSAPSGRGFVTLASAALQGAADVLRDKVRSRPRDVVGVIAYGTIRSRNQMNVPGVWVVRELAPPSVNAIRAVQGLADALAAGPVAATPPGEVDETDVAGVILPGHLNAVGGVSTGGRAGVADQNDTGCHFAHALWVARVMLLRAKKGPAFGTTGSGVVGGGATAERTRERFLAHKRVFVVTNCDDPAAGNAEELKAAAKQAVDLADIGAFVRLVPLLGTPVLPAMPAGTAVAAPSSSSGALLAGFTPSAGLSQLPMGQAFSPDSSSRGLPGAPGRPTPSFDVHKFFAQIVFHTEAADADAAEGVAAGLLDVAPSSNVEAIRETLRRQGTPKRAVARTVLRIGRGLHGSTSAALTQLSQPSQPSATTPVGGGSQSEPLTPKDKVLTVGIAVYNRVSKPPVPPKVLVDRRTNLPATATSVTWCNETARPLPTADAVRHAYTLVEGADAAFTAAELAEIRCAHQRGGLHLLGVQSAGSLPRPEWSVKASSFVVADDSVWAGSGVALAALHDGCLRRKKVILVAGSLRQSGSGLRLGVLVPAEEKLDESGAVQIEPPGFHLTWLPFADDLYDGWKAVVPTPAVDPPTGADADAPPVGVRRRRPVGDSDSTSQGEERDDKEEVGDIPRPPATTEELDGDVVPFGTAVATQVVRKMGLPLDFRPWKLKDPALTRHWEVVQAIALAEALPATGIPAGLSGALSPAAATGDPEGANGHDLSAAAAVAALPPDPLMPDDAAIEASAADALAAFRSAVLGGPSFDAVAAAARYGTASSRAAALRAEKAAIKASEAAVKQDEAAAALADVGPFDADAGPGEDGCLDRKTVPQLKVYCTAHGLPLGGRKAEVVARVRLHLVKAADAAAAGGTAPHYLFF